MLTLEAEAVAGVAAVLAPAADVPVSAAAAAAVVAAAAPLPRTAAHETAAHEPAGPSRGIYCDRMGRLELLPSYAPPPLPTTHWMGLQQVVLAS